VKSESVFASSQQISPVKHEEVICPVKHEEVACPIKHEEVTCSVEHEEEGVTDNTDSGIHWKLEQNESTSPAADNKALDIADEEEVLKDYGVGQVDKSAVDSPSITKNMGDLLYSEECCENLMRAVRLVADSGIEVHMQLFFPD
jgi:hypothetical protein